MAEVQIPTDLDPYVIVPIKLTNSSDVSVSLAEEATQTETKDFVAAPKTLGAGETVEFTLTQGDKLKYTLEGVGDFKIVFDDDKDHPKLKAGDEFEGDSPSHGIRTTKKEVKTESEVEIEEEVEEEWTAGKSEPESSKSEEKETEVKTGNIEIEIKEKKKEKTKGREKKTTITKKTETKKVQTSLAFEIYKV